LKYSTPPNLNQPWTKYPNAVGPRPVSRPPAPSSAITFWNPETIPVYLAGSSCMRVFTTSTGVSAPCVTEQQMPPAKAPFRK
jgi:hypothetical protein